MSKTNGTGLNQRNNPYQLEELFARWNRTPAGIAWRWRTELLTLSTLAVTFWRLDIWTTAIWAGIILAALAAVAFAVPHSRRFITRRFWCVLASHRLQRLCYEARLHTRSGRLPLILWTRPTKVGERTWVLCRAGICAEDFEAHTGELRAACYARDARVTRNRRWFPPGDHRHHPPRHPRGPRAHRLPARAPYRALPPAGPSPRHRFGPCSLARRPRRLGRHQPGVPRRG